MIQNDTELQATQEQIRRFERFLAEARKTESASNYGTMAEGYLSEIQKMQAEIREYLSRVPDKVEAA
jgi:D-serine dehydratase